MNTHMLKTSTAEFVLISTTLLLGNTLAWSSDTTSDPLKEQSKPKSTINFGAGYLFNDNARFGQYTGLRNDGPYGIFNLDIKRRNDETGTWLKLFGRNIGFQNRDVRFEHNKQGNWGYFLSLIHI